MWLLACRFCLLLVLFVWKMVTVTDHFIRWNNRYLCDGPNWYIHIPCFEILGKRRVRLLYLPCRHSIPYVGPFHSHATTYEKLWTNASYHYCHDCWSSQIPLYLVSHFGLPLLCGMSHLRRALRILKVVKCIPDSLPGSPRWDRFWAFWKFDYWQVLWRDILGICCHNQLYSSTKLHSRHSRSHLQQSFRVESWDLLWWSNCSHPNLWGRYQVWKSDRRFSSL